MTAAAGPLFLDDKAVLDGLVSIAKRELLALTVAQQSWDDDGELLASARVESSLACARELVARNRSLAPNAEPRLAALETSARRWLSHERRRRAACLLDPSAARALRRDRTIDAIAAKLDELDLDDVDLSRLVLSHAEVTRTTARRAVLDALDARQATIIHCRFEASSMTRAWLSGITIEDSELTRVNLDGADLRGAKIARSRLTGSILTDAILDDAEFVGCDLRGVTFAIERRPAGVVGSIVFRDCDLRDTRWSGRSLHGATFVDCKLFGMRDAPQLVDAVVERPDLSRAGDGSQIAGAGDAAVAWRSGPVEGRGT